jgi:putative sigma-54 modulation protein
VQISISAKHGHISSATQDKISEKVDKLKKFFDRVTAIQVLVDLEHREAIDVEVRVTAEHTPEFVASERTNELFAGLDAVLHKLEQQLRKHKERLQTGHRQPGRKQLDVPLQPDNQPE